MQKRNLGIYLCPQCRTMLSREFETEIPQTQACLNPNCKKKGQVMELKQTSYQWTKTSEERHADRQRRKKKPSFMEWRERFSIYS